MTASTHRKIRKNNRFWVTKTQKSGKKPLTAPVKTTYGPVLMASDTYGTKKDNTNFLYYTAGENEGKVLTFTIDTTKNPDNSSDATFIVPFTLYTPNYAFSIEWGDGNTTNITAGTSLTTAILSHTYATAGVYSVRIISESKKMPVLNWQTSGNTGGNKHKLIQLNSPLIAFDTSCPNYNSAQYFAYECSNLESIPYQFFRFNGQIQNYNYCFSRCPKLVRIPEDLLRYVKHQSTYQEFLSGNTTLQYVPNDLFAYAKGTDFSGAFKGDSNLLLDVDLDTLFGTEPYINTDVHEMFKDCVNTTGDAVEFVNKFTEYVAYVEGTGTFDTGWGTLSGKIYAQPIYNSDGELVRDLIPAKTGNFYGGKVAPQDCLWDEVQQEFLLPTTTYTYGTEIDMRSAFVIEDGELISVNENVYLQNTGTSYVNTGITADSDTSLVINYKIDSSREIASGTRNWICGGSALYNKLGNFYAGFWQTSATNIYYWLNTSNKGAGLNAGSAFTDFSAKYKIELNGANINTTTYLYKNNTTTWTYPNNTGEITQSSPITLFNRYASLSSTSNYFLGRVYDCSISKSGVLLQKLVPVPKGLVIGDFVVPSNGMFDIVTQTFYGNEGAGEFNIGTDTPLDIDRENNLPYSFKKDALENCDLWTNIALPETAWTGCPGVGDNWLALTSGKKDWLIVDPQNIFLLESNDYDVTYNGVDSILADTTNTLSTETGPRPSRTTPGIIKPEPYETVESLRNIINMLPENVGYTIVGNPTIENGIASDFSLDDYLKVSEVFAPGNNPWIQQVKFKLAYPGSAVRMAITNETKGDYRAPKMEMSTTSSTSLTIQVRIAGASGSWSILSANYPVTCDYNKWSYLWYEFTGTQYVIKFKQQGDASYTSVATKNSTDVIYQDPASTGISLGADISSGSQWVSYFDGQIDLKETFFSINNKVWFDGTEKLNEVVDLSACVNKGELTSADLQTIIDKGYTLILN